MPILTSKETYSPGDAMRDIYTRGLVTTDFILVMGDLVSNIRIDEVVRVHKERRKTNKDAIMTMVVKESGPEHRTRWVLQTPCPICLRLFTTGLFRSRGESSIFILDAETSECLHYESITGSRSTKVIQVPREILAEHPELEIRNDLMDCFIDVCSVEVRIFPPPPFFLGIYASQTMAVMIRISDMFLIQVPSLFQDNFDYLDIRRDFVHGILTSDLLMKSIHVYVAREGYAARVQDTRSYESVR